MRVLAIETSCDETAAAVVEASGIGQQATGAPVRVLSSVVASQADLHARTAGVVPEVAARAHVEAITFVVDDALRRAVGSRHPTPLASAELRGASEAVGADAATSYQLQATSLIDAIAATTEPGLRPALVIGETAARALAVAWGKPFIPVNHLAGHIAAAWLVSYAQPQVGHRFPAVALVVSGGHTQLWFLAPRARGIVNYITSESASAGGVWELRRLSETRDDAAGEAFDKIARLLGLPYPGGAALAKLAEHGDACEYAFPRPMISSGDLDFSFSGLKTAVFYTVRDLQATSYPSRLGRPSGLSPAETDAATGQLQAQARADVAAGAQEAIVDVLVSKTVDAAEREDAAEVILTGGVAANARLRARLKQALGARPLVVPAPEFCTDNAAMIGAAAVLGLRLLGSS